MIDPAKLTADQGFVDGVVVEIVWSQIAGGHTEFINRDQYRFYTRETIRNILSIRPLTGPMAIWNFAPEWAEWCMVWRDMEVWWSIPEPKGHNDWTVTERPFWARGEK